jgi:hypothetical protein
MRTQPGPDGLGAGSVIRSVIAGVPLLLLTACGGTDPAILIDEAGTEIDDVSDLEFETTPQTTDENDSQLSLDENQDGTTHTSDAVEVVGDAAPGSRIAVDGVSGSVIASQDGSFRLVVPLELGANDIVIRAVAPDGTESTSRLRLVRNPDDGDDGESSP